MKIELKNVKYFESMSEETACFQADIFVNGKKVGYCKNDGQGGETFVAPYPEHRSIFNNAAEYCTTLPPAYVGEKITIRNSLSHVVDDLLMDWLKAKELKKLEKNCEKGICHALSENELSYVIQNFKMGGRNATIKELIAHPKGVEALKNCCARLKAEGRKILNKNLPFEV